MPLSRSAPRRAWLLLVISAATGAAAPAQEPNTTPPAKGSDFARAFAPFAARLKEAPGYRVEVVEDWSSTGGALSEKGSTRYELALKRPDRFVLKVRPGDEPAPTIELGIVGETLTGLLRKPSAIHAKARRRDPAEGLRRNPMLLTAVSGSFLDVLVRADLADFVADRFTGSADLGVETLDQPAGPARHFRGGWSDGRTLELWITEGTAPELVRIKFTRIVPSVKPGAEPFTMTQTARFNWKFGRDLADELFQVSPSKESKEVDDLYAAVSGAGEVLVPGAKAPEIDLEVLGGGRLSLADHQGRDIVVLNFWASWYPIGLESLPTVAEFAREYENKGVAIYQVNLGESADVVTRQVEALKLPLIVALDPQGRLIERYAVKALPFSVIVGKDGTIQAVNAGDLRGFKERFRQQLDTLVSGKVLVPPK